MKELDLGEMTREQIKSYCQASGDWNKIHWDDTFARESGLPSVIAHGMLSMGLVGRALAEWGYDLKLLGTFDSKFKDKVLPGDRLKVRLQNQDEITYPSKLDLVVLNQNGLEILTATAEFKSSS